MAEKEPPATQRLDSEGERKFSGNLAQLLDEVPWDYEETELSPLTTTERFFRDFPWGAEG